MKFMEMRNIHLIEGLLLGGSRRGTGEGYMRVQRCLSCFIA